MYTQAKAHPVPIATVTNKYWGYTSPTTGPASVTYAALKRYGLIDDEGNGDSRVAHLTDLAVKILHPNAQREEAIREAALRPDIIRDWWERYGTELPPDDALQWEHVINGPFAEDGLNTFLRVYRDTVSYAKLASSDTVGREIDPDGGSHGDDQGEFIDGVSGAESSDVHETQAGRPQWIQREPRAGVLTIPIPLPGSDPVVVEFPGKLPEADWDYFLTLLAAMKAGIVASPSSEVDEV
jgi:hypothetical protein